MNLDRSYEIWNIWYLDTILEIQNIITDSYAHLYQRQGIWQTMFVCAYSATHSN